MPISERSPHGQMLQRKEWQKNSISYRTRKFLATSLILQASDNEDKLECNPSSNLSLTFIFKPEDKIFDVAFENILSVLKKSKLKMKGN